MRCASCGAHLQYQTETPDKCTYCGSRVRMPGQKHTAHASISKGGKTIVFLVVGIIVAIMAVVGVFVFSVINTVKDAVTINIPTVPTIPGKQVPTSAFAEEVLRFGGEGNGIGKFEDNRSVAIDGNNNIFSTDYAGGRVQVFDANGKFVKQWMNDLKYIPDMCVSRDGIVYIMSGSKITSFEGETGNKLKESNRVFFNNMTIMADDNIIGTTSNGDIYKLDKDLKTIASSKNIMAKAGMENNLTNGIACNGLGEIFVLDFMGQHVYHFSRKMEFVDKFKTKASSGNDIAVDAKGRIYISAMNEIYVYDAEGEFLHSFTAKQAFGMAFDSEGNLWVAQRPYVVKYNIKK